MAFDPMTGKAIEEDAEIKFDPMTGKPIEEDAEVRFDPMTGKPIKEDAEVRFDPMTGKPIKNKDAKKAGLSGMTEIAKIAAVLVLIAVIVLIAISSGLFRSRAGKVMLASANTIKDAPHFVKALKPLKILNGKKYTLTFEHETASIDIGGELRNGGSEKQIAMTLGRGGETLELLAGVDSKSARLYVPALSKYVFVYHYQEKNNGYLLGVFDDDDIEHINAMLESIVENTNTKEIYAELYKIFKDELKNVTFVDADREEYTINDKDVRCKGYTAVIKSSNLIRVADKIEKLIHDKYADLPEMDDLSEEFDELRDELEKIERIKLTFYIYKNKLASIIYEDTQETEKIELCFEGGDYRMQNMVLKIGNDRLRITGSDDGTKETFALETRTNGGSKSKIGSLAYDYKNGWFSVELPGMEAEGELISSNSKLNLKISDVALAGYHILPELEISLKKGAKMEKYGGKEFDLGNADKEECQELREDIQDKIYDGGFESIIRFLDLSGILLD